ncbi:hypothetical protein CC79DRAFT_172336 [Sarocladium strictum]
MFSREHTCHMISVLAFAFVSVAATIPASYTLLSAVCVLSPTVDAAQHKSRQLPTGATAH